MNYLFKKDDISLRISRISGDAKSKSNIINTIAIHNFIDILSPHNSSLPHLIAIFFQPAKI